MTDKQTTHAAEIAEELRVIKENTPLYETENYSIRRDAIDVLDFHIIDRIDGLTAQGITTPNLSTIKAEAVLLIHKLECIDDQLFALLRQDIANGDCLGTSLLIMLRKYLPDYFASASETTTIGYDVLDNFINGLLCAAPIPEPETDRRPGMVFYQQTPARIILQLAEAAQLTHEEVFYDIGSGLGHVPVLLHLLTGCIARGVEYDPAYCSYASNSVNALKLTGVSFINTDARTADYTDGTTFFLYTPFGGTMLQDMLDILAYNARQRPIGVFTYGPCSATVAGQNWLQCTRGTPDDIYSLCAFHTPAI
jgi:hypothetical protein